MSLGIWADFPPLQGNQLYDMTIPGKVVAIVLNTLVAVDRFRGSSLHSEKIRGGMNPSVPEDREKFRVANDLHRDPLVTRAPFLEETIRSVLDQDYPDL